jgi:hypothetical protein
VSVGGNWVASSLAAGVDPGPDGVFGTEDDALASPHPPDAPVSRIGSVVIRGEVKGTRAPDDHFGFAAQQIDAFFSGKGGGLPLLPGPGNDDFPLGRTGDVRLREVAAPPAPPDGGELPPP